VRLTPRDLGVLRFTVRHGMVTPDQLAARFFTSAPPARPSMPCETGSSWRANAAVTPANAAAGVTRRSPQEEAVSAGVAGWPGQRG
jgi:hypothetical protein